MRWPTGWADIEAATSRRPWRSSRCRRWPSAGGRVMLCTDGLTGMIDVDRIQAILEDESDPQAAAELLVDAANAAGGEDNITVIVLDFEEDGEGSEGGAASAMPTGAPGARSD